MKENKPRNAFGYHKKIIAIIIIIIINIRYFSFNK